MPVDRQEALIVPPRGVQVGPGAVGGVITPRSLVQHGDAQDEEEEEMGTYDGQKEKEACGEIYEEVNVRSAPVKVRMKLKVSEDQVAGRRRFCALHHRLYINDRHTVGGVFSLTQLLI